MARAKKAPSAPTCIFCKRSHGAQFAIFNPRFAPLGTACVDCESDHANHVTADGIPMRLQLDATTGATVLAPLA